MNLFNLTRPLILTAIEKILPNMEIYISYLEECVKRLNRRAIGSLIYIVFHLKVKL